METPFIRYWSDALSNYSDFIEAMIEKWHIGSKSLRDFIIDMEYMADQAEEREDEEEWEYDEVLPYNWD